jgi:hypothetical protein
MRQARIVTIIYGLRGLRSQTAVCRARPIGDAASGGAAGPHSMRRGVNANPLVCGIHAVHLL